MVSKIGELKADGSVGLTFDLLKREDRKLCVIGLKPKNVDDQSKLFLIPDDCPELVEITCVKIFETEVSIGIVVPKTWLPEFLLPTFDEPDRAFQFIIVPNNWLIEEIDAPIDGLDHIVIEAIDKEKESSEKMVHKEYLKFMKMYQMGIINSSEVVSRINNTLDYAHKLAKFSITATRYGDFKI